LLPGASEGFSGERAATASPKLRFQIILVHAVLPTKGYHVRNSNQES
jgi:hypothetical protein